MDPTLAYTAGANILNEIFKPLGTGVEKSPGIGRARGRARGRSRGPSTDSVNGHKIWYQPGAKSILKSKLAEPVQELEEPKEAKGTTKDKKEIKIQDKENLKEASKPNGVEDKDKSEVVPLKKYNLRRRSAVPIQETVAPVPALALPIQEITNGQFASAEEDTTVHQGEPWTIVDQKMADLTIMKVLNDNEKLVKVAKADPLIGGANEPIVKSLKLSGAPLLVNSPVAGGNLGGKVKHIIERIPSSPPCSSSTMSSEGIASRLKNLTGIDSGIFKPSTTSVENLGAYENLHSNSPSKHPVSLVEHEVLKSCDAEFMPVSLAKGREYLFVTSQQTNQVQVYREKSQQGVLKMNDTKYFSGLHCVHFIEMPKACDDRLVVLDNEGFHFFNEHGLYLHTVMEMEGYKYRGLGHVIFKERLCLVTLDINDKGVCVLLMDLQKGSDSYQTFIKRIQIIETRDLKDEVTKCRFIAVTNYNQILVTAMKLNHIYLVNLDSEVTRILGPFTKPEDKDKPENSFGIVQPSGIVVDKKSGYVFISSRGNKRIEILNKNFVYEASHERKAGKFDPVGLAVINDTLYVANNCYRNILTFRFKH